MHLTCTMAQALFPSEDVKLYTEKPLSLLWDCHHGDTFVLRVEGLAVAPQSGETAASPIILEMSLAPPSEIISKFEHFAARHTLALAPWPTLPDELVEPLTLAAGHLPETKVFVFCETATLTARATPEGNMQLMVAGDFKSRKVPCQETDLLLHLERAPSTRLLSYCFTVVRGRSS
jgi:hypothetical protein